VDGIAQVHGIDEDEARRIGAVAWTCDGSGGGGGGVGGLGYPLGGPGSSGMHSGSIDLGTGQVRCVLLVKGCPLFGCYATLPAACCTAAEALLFTVAAAA
jgi:hypothetical protein